MRRQGGSRRLATLSLSLLLIGGGLLPASALHLPRYDASAAATTAGGDAAVSLAGPLSGVRSQAAGPLPVGVGDAGTASEQRYSTRGLLGTLTIGALATDNASLGGSRYGVSAQLNAFLVFVLNGTRFDYWVQDVMELDTSTHVAYFEDNVWNASSAATSVLNASAISGSGTISPSPDGAYYATTASPALPGSTPTLVYPETVRLELNATLGSGGTPRVAFEYEDGFGMTRFDTVSFPFARGGTGFGGFDVDSGALGPACPRCVDDVEFVVGGPSGGAATTTSGTTQLTLQLREWTGSNFGAVPDADNHGFATAEALSGASVVRQTAVGGTPEASVAEGAFSSGPLWRLSQLAGLWVTVGTSGGAGTASLNGAATSFQNGSFSLSVWPGVYNLSVNVGIGTYTLLGITLSAGQLFTDEVGAIAVVFLPDGLANLTVWSVTLGGETLRGTGPITFGVGNGTYNYTVSTLAGYSVSPSSGNVTVAGAPESLTIVFTSTPDRTWAELVHLLELRIGPVPFYLVLVVLTVAGLLAAALGRRGRRRRQRPAFQPKEREFDWDAPP